MFSDVFRTPIKATPEELVQDAQNITLSCFKDAVHCIDDEFGAGFAAKRPDLVAAYIKTVGDTFNVTNKTQFGQEIGAVLCDLLSEVSSSLSEISNSMKD